MGEECKRARGSWPAPANFLNLQALVFALVAAALTTVYITQPVLPVLQQEFGVSASQASLTVSAVILGIALANLPFGTLADRFPIKPLILLGGLVVAACSVFCAATGSLALLVGARLLQGLFIPCLTTCLAAYLSRSLPVERLNVVMGSYVSATVVGGLGGRLLGGWIHPPLHWRYAFVSAAALVLFATFAATRWLPPEEARTEPVRPEGGFLKLLGRRELRQNYFVTFGTMFVFASIFNYLPFYLAGPPFQASTHLITLMYFSYLVGILTGPMAGWLSNRLGNGGTMVLGAVIFAFAIMLTFVQSILAILAALALVCAGHFAIHAAAVGSLNRKLTGQRGQANSLYVLFYYLGGSVGITASGYAYGLAGWTGVGVLGVLILSVPLVIGLQERRAGEQAVGGVPESDSSVGEP